MNGAIDLTTRVALVTGGASGMGRTTAIALAAAGAAVMIGDLDLNGAGETVRLIAEAGGTAAARAVDVGDRTQAERIVADTVAAFGGLHIAFNNAGAGAPPTSVIDAEEADLDRLWRINVKGVWNCLRPELALMGAAGGGVIVNTASATALRPRAGMAPYSLTKAAVVHLSQVAALEHAAAGVRVNALCPGPVRTPMLEQLPPTVLERLAENLPLGRLGTAEEVAGTVLWLCSPAAAFVTGTAIVMDGGESV